ncbi:hypothetical protein SKAU_G00296790 [Synaphobranchus kaupii]|uniref:Uncharacterized protein n=1 Tax=Synaphobranchus kaupii TaxID=118154 RepID=A0A9Q1EUV7_SYNKA|nr:hypothetical protein SKAU_G00296790 [Synaphobranchus kaupii]
MLRTSDAHRIVLGFGDGGRSAFCARNMLADAMGVCARFHEQPRRNEGRQIRDLSRILVASTSAADGSITSKSIIAAPGPAPARPSALLRVHERRQPAVIPWASAN